MKRPGTSPINASRRHMSASLPNLLLSSSSRQTKSKLRRLISSPQTGGSPTRKRAIASSLSPSRSQLRKSPPYHSQIYKQNSKLPPHLVASTEDFINFLQTDWAIELNTRPKYSTTLAKKRSDVKRAAKRLFDGTADFMEVQVASFKNYMSNEWPGVRRQLAHRQCQTIAVTITRSRIVLIMK